MCLRGCSKPRWMMGDCSACWATTVLSVLVAVMDRRYLVVDETRCLTGPDNSRKESWCSFQTGTGVWVCLCGTMMVHTRSLSPRDALLTHASPRSCRITNTVALVCFIDCWDLLAVQPASKAKEHTVSCRLCATARVPRGARPLVVYRQDEKEGLGLRPSISSHIILPPAAGELCVSRVSFEDSPVSQYHMTSPTKAGTCCALWSKLGCFRTRVPSFPG